MTHWWDARFNREIDRERALRLAEEDSLRALAIDPDLGISHMLCGGIAWLRGKHASAVEYAGRAVSLVPSDAHSVAFLGMLHMYGGQYEKSMAMLKHAMRLSPQYPSWFTYYVAFNHLWTGNFEGALEQAQLYLSREPDEPFAYALFATIHAFQGRKEEAARMIAELTLRFPGFGLAEMRLSQLYSEQEKFTKVIAALRAAGMPD
jgi:tetratricopeptide (TPR) repeat protein